MGNGRREGRDRPENAGPLCENKGSRITTSISGGSGSRLCGTPSRALAYLSYMSERLAEARRLLKPTGSIYLHCDPTMSHYLKAVMDDVFGVKNFRNEIIWSGIPHDLSSARKLAQDKPFDFEKWAICRIPGLAPNARQVGDGGIDGRGLLLNAPDDHDSRLVLAQVKGGKFQASGLRDFLGVMERDRAAMGVFITLNSATSPHAHTEAGRKGSIRMGASQYPRAQLWSIDDHFRKNQPHMPPLADPYTGKEMQQPLF